LTPPRAGIARIMARQAFMRRPIPTTAGYDRPGREIGGGSGKNPLDNKPIIRYKKFESDALIKFPNENNIFAQTSDPLGL
jgi:hypothetical protein